MQVELIFLTVPKWLQNRTSLFAVALGGAGAGAG